MSHLNHTSMENNIDNMGMASLVVDDTMGNAVMGETMSNMGEIVDMDIEEIVDMKNMGNISQ